MFELFCLLGVFLGAGGSRKERKPSVVPTRTLIWFPFRLTQENWVLGTTGGTKRTVRGPLNPTGGLGLHLVRGGRVG